LTIINSTTSKMQVHRVDTFANDVSSGDLKEVQTSMSDNNILVKKGQVLSGIKRNYKLNSFKNS